jgi:4-hydroxy-2-oxoheptanedioate aldolase
MAPRINRAIAKLSISEPIYYTGDHISSHLTYEKGQRMANTWADYINMGMEHGVFDGNGLDAYMNGLRDSGPTESGHPTPAVIAELPVTGTSKASIMSNAWQITQLLARGIHGLVLCHAELSEAVQAFVECARYPFHKSGVGSELQEGRRGSAGQETAARIWGVSPEKYLEISDPWPLNSKGELLLGVKIENKKALSNVEKTLTVPGIAFAEWGPGDMSMSFGYTEIPNPLSAELLEARERVFSACRANGLRFLENASPTTVAKKIDEGVAIIAAADPDGEQTAKVGRHHSTAKPKT